MIPTCESGHNRCAYVAVWNNTPYNRSPIDVSVDESSAIWQPFPNKGFQSRHTFWATDFTCCNPTHKGELPPSFLGHYVLLSSSSGAFDDGAGFSVRMAAVNSTWIDVIGKAPQDSDGATSAVLTEPPGPGPVFSITAPNSHGASSNDSAVVNVRIDYTDCATPPE
ncbi:MAG: hypothetical protein P8R42_05545 [Candidatus Binatia bacterium]|nr:hypothetical protein [Candidatus Binatia bacterium]